MSREVKESEALPSLGPLCGADPTVKALYKLSSWIPATTLGGRHYHLPFRLLKLREVKRLAPGHTAGKWTSEPGVPDSKPSSTSPHPQPPVHPFWELKVNFTAGVLVNRHQMLANSFVTIC